MFLSQSHPFPVVARFERVIALSFAFPADALAPLVPAGLEIDTYEGSGFLTVAMVWTRNLRPAGFPAIFGHNFFLAGYRIFTRLRSADGRKLRGLRILRTETDGHSMVLLGNLMTGYNYRRIRLRQIIEGNDLHISTALPDGKSTLDLKLCLDPADAALPAGSPFPDWRTARRFAGPMPFTFSPKSDGSFVVVEGGRENWHPRPVAVRQWSVGLFDEPPLTGIAPVLANAFIIENVDYRWERGFVVNSPLTP